MDFNLVTLKNIPEDSFIIRVKNTDSYIHYDGIKMSFKNKMTGCFVCCKETAETIKVLLMFTSDNKYELEVALFKQAYQQHGLVEKQIMYN